MKIKQWLRDNWASTLLAAFMLISLPLGLSAGGWLSSNEVLWSAAIGSMIAGLLLRIIRRPAVLAGLALITGMLFITQVESRALPPVRPALRELVSLGQWADLELNKIVDRATTDPETEEPPPPLPPPDLPEWRAARDRLVIYGWNLQADWPPKLVPTLWSRGQTLLGSLLGLLVWLIVIPSVWLLTRQRSIWWAMLPVMSILTLNTYYTGIGWEHLALCLSAGLMLAGITMQSRLEGRWGTEALPYWLGLDRWGSSGGITMVVVLTMALTIQLTDPDFQQEVRDILNPPEKTTAGEAAGGRRGSGEARPGLWPREHLLGSGPELSTQPVMSVYTPGVAPARFYWKATSYGQYTGHGWRTSQSRLAGDNAEPLWPESPEPPPHFVLLRQSFRFESSTEQIYSAGRPVRLSQGAEGVWSDPLRMDLISVNTVTTQSAYEALAWIPSVTPDELRTASDNYPDWVVETYLALPDELPGRVRMLAEEVVADESTAYGKALAIQNYLRSNYPYTLDLDTPPTDQDVVDYFLFDLQKGYCDYYASAMTVMARSVGLPARLAVGYATGAYDPDSQSYRVSMAEAHSWVEIYFPEYGWIAFEPTASLAVIEHGAIGEWVEEAALTSQENIEAFEQENTSPGIGLKEGVWLLGIVFVMVVLAVGGVALVGVIGGQRRKRGTPEHIVTSLYRDLMAGGRRLGLALSVTQTPHEFLMALRSELVTRAEHGPRRMGDWDARLAQTGHMADELVSLYEDMCYSPQQLEPAPVYKLLDSWPRLNRALWLFWLAGRRQPKVEDVS